MNKKKMDISIQMKDPKYSKQFKTERERNDAMDHCMCVDFMVNQLEVKIRDLLKSVEPERQKLRKEGYLV